MSLTIDSARPTPAERTAEGDVRPQPAIRVRREPPIMAQPSAEQSDDPASSDPLITSAQRYAQLQQPSRGSHEGHNDEDISCGEQACYMTIGTALGTALSGALCGLSLGASLCFGVGTGTILSYFASQSEDNDLPSLSPEEKEWVINPENKCPLSLQPIAPEDVVYIVDSDNKTAHKFDRYWLYTHLQENDFNPVNRQQITSDMLKGPATE